MFVVGDKVSVSLHECVHDPRGHLVVCPDGSVFVIEDKIVVRLLNEDVVLCKLLCLKVLSVIKTGSRIEIVFAIQRHLLSKPCRYQRGRRT